MSRRRKTRTANTAPDIFEVVESTPRKVEPPPEPERPKRRSNPATEVGQVSGFVIGEHEYIHAFVCPGTKHRYVVATAAMSKPVQCPTCGNEMHRHFFSKRRQ